MDITAAWRQHVSKIQLDCGFLFFSSELQTNFLPTAVMGPKKGPATAMKRPATKTKSTPKEKGDEDEDGENSEEMEGSPTPEGSARAAQAKAKPEAKSKAKAKAKGKPQAKPKGKPGVEVLAGAF